MTRSIAKSEFASIKAVCIGGGTGVPMSIRALTLLDINPDAIVSVADDGGSSGLLRTHTGQVPPGDLRKCLVALAKEQESPWVSAFKERFEYCNNHALGNLILTALQETTHSLEESITLCEELLQTRGHVLPASFKSILLMGTTRDGQKLVGQSTLCKSETALARVRMEPADAPANPAALAAIDQADLIVLGPGSLFTSIIPNLLIPQILDAIRRSSAATVFVCSLADVQGETWGLDAAEHIEALESHGLQGRLDYALFNDRGASEKVGNVTGYFSAIRSDSGQHALSEPEQTASLRYVELETEAIADIRKRGVKVLTRDMNDEQHPSWHNPQKLARAIASIIADSKGL